MLFRAIALTLALLVGIGTIVPLGTDSAQAGSRTTKKYKKHKKYKKYSKRWWRQYHARMNRKHALQARRRAMRLHQLRLAKKRGTADGLIAICLPTLTSRLRSSPGTTVTFSPISGFSTERRSGGTASQNRLRISRIVLI